MGGGGNPVDLKVDEEGVAWGMGMNGWIHLPLGGRERERGMNMNTVWPQPLDERKKIKHLGKMKT